MSEHEPLSDAWFDWIDARGDLSERECYSEVAATALEWAADDVEQWDETTTSMAATSLRAKAQEIRGEASTPEQ